MTSPEENIKIISKNSNFHFVEQWFDLADENHYWMQWRLRAFLNLIKSLGMPLTSEWKGLEVGCGNGTFRQQIENVTRWKIDGTDIDLEALKRNPSCRGKIFLYDILEKNKEFKQQYDFIILFDIL